MNLESHFAPLLDLLLKSAAILLLAMLLHAAFRRASAANRHALVLTVFAALLLLPFTKLIPPRWAFAPEKRTEPAVNVRLPLIATAHTPEQRTIVSPVEIAARPAARTPLVIPWTTLDNHHLTEL